MNIFHENPVSSANPKPVMGIEKNCCAEFVCKIFFWCAIHGASCGVDIQNIKSLCHRVNGPYVFPNQCRIRLPSKLFRHVETGWGALYITVVQIKKTECIFFVVE